MNTDGALYESFSRGKKDSFFIRDSPESVHLFDNRYNPQAQTIYELRRTVPLTAPAWGRPLEFELEIAGDLSTDHTILIDLPSAIPTTIQRWPIFTDASGTNALPAPNPAYFLFEKIQFFQDALLLQEVSGDSLYFKTLLDSSINQFQLNQRLTNQRAGAQYLRLPLPIPQPLPALSGQTFRLKVFLRKQPVSQLPSTLYYKTSPTADPVAFTTLPIGNPTLLLESKQVYLQPQAQKEYKEKIHYIPYIRFYENTFQISPQEYARGGVLTRRLEGRHPAGRLFFYFRNAQELAAGNLQNITNAGSDPSFWSSLSFLVAGQEREFSWSPSVWRNISQHAKADRSEATIQQLGLIDWQLGDLQERRLPYEKTPEGAVNFTTADRPTVLFTVTPTAGLASELRIVIESWATLVVEDGRARLQSAN